MGGYLVLILLMLLPDLLAAGIYFVLLRVAFRMKSPIRPLVLYPAIASAVLCAGFLVWSHVQWFSLGPTAKALSIPMNSLLIVPLIFVGFITSWSLMYVVRFVQETVWKWEPKITRLIFFIPAVVILGFTVWTVQGGVRRSMQLSAASSETIDHESRRRIVDRALLEHDVDVLSALAENPQTSAADLVRIYDACKPRLNRTSKESRVLTSLGSNPNAPPEMLAALAKAYAVSPRSAVAENPSTPVESLRGLAGDKEDMVRRSVTRNPSVPADLLEQLSQDQDEFTANHAKHSMAQREEGDGSLR